MLQVVGRGGLRLEREVVLEIRLRSNLVVSSADHPLWIASTFTPMNWWRKTYHSFLVEGRDGGFWNLQSSRTCVWRQVEQQRSERCAVEQPSLRAHPSRCLLIASTLCEARLPVNLGYCITPLSVCKNTENTIRYWDTSSLHLVCIKISLQALYFKKTYLLNLCCCHGNGLHKVNNKLKTK